MEIEKKWLQDMTQSMHSIQRSVFVRLTSVDIIHDIISMTILFLLWTEAGTIWLYAKSIQRRTIAAFRTNWTDRQRKLTILAENRAWNIEQIWEIWFNLRASNIPSLVLLNIYICIPSVRDRIVKFTQCSKWMEVEYTPPSFFVWKNSPGICDSLSIYFCYFCSNSFVIVDVIEILHRMQKRAGHDPNDDAK